jgi:hypothetical protein
MEQGSRPVQAREVGGSNRLYWPGHVCIQKERSMLLHVPLLAWWMIVLCQTDCRKTRPSPGGGVEVRSGLGSSGEESAAVLVLAWWGRRRGLCLRDCAPSPVDHAKPPRHGFVHPSGTIQRQIRVSQATGNNRQSRHWSDGSICSIGLPMEL